MLKLIICDPCFSLVFNERWVKICVQNLLYPAPDSYIYFFVVSAQSCQITVQVFFLLSSLIMAK